MNSLNKKAQIKYISGFFDAEGFVYIAKQYYKKRPIYYLKVGISNTDLRPLKMIQNIFGGDIIEYTPNNHKHQKQYRFFLMYNKAKNFLEAISKYIIIKKKQSELALQFHNDCWGKRNRSIKIQEKYKKKISQKCFINKRNQNRTRINDFSLEYIAGFFDGDGCIYIGLCKQVSSGHKTHFALRCKTVNKFKPLLDIMKNKFGGGIRAMYSPKWCFEHQTSANNAKIFLDMIKDFLIIKKKQAKLAIRFQNNMSSSKCKSLSNKEFNIRLKFKEKLAKLKTIHV